MLNRREDVHITVYKFVEGIKPVFVFSILIFTGGLFRPSWLHPPPPLSLSHTHTHTHTHTPTHPHTQLLP